MSTPAEPIVQLIHSRRAEAAARACLAWERYCWADGPRPEFPPCSFGCTDEELDVALKKIEGEMWAAPTAVA